MIDPGSLFIGVVIGVPAGVLIVFGLMVAFFREVAREG